jgi:hypothetical protein
MWLNNIFDDIQSSCALAITAEKKMMKYPIFALAAATR